jgi:hypothetical protein
MVGHVLSAMHIPIYIALSSSSPPLLLSHISCPESSSYYLYIIVSPRDLYNTINRFKTENITIILDLDKVAYLLRNL